MIFVLCVFLFEFDTFLFLLLCRRERSYKVAIKFVARANMHHLGEFLAGKRADGPQEALQILDIVLRELSVKRFCPVGRSFFSPDIRTPQRLGEGLESWCGFYQSIRPTQMGLSLNIGKNRLQR